MTRWLTTFLVGSVLWMASAAGAQAPCPKGKPNCKDKAAAAQTSPAPSPAPPPGGAVLVLPGQSVADVPPVPPPPAAAPAAAPQTVAPTQTFAPTTEVGPPPPSPPEPEVLAAPPQPLPPPVLDQEYIIPERRRRHRERVPRDPRTMNVGVHAEFAGGMGDSTVYAGAAGGIRFRPELGFFALQFGIGAFVGSDYNDRARSYVPVTVDTYFYFNPRSPVQFYGTAGVGMAWSGADGEYVGGRMTDDHVTYLEVGGRAGVGAEIKAGSRMGVHFDVRGVLQHNVSSKHSPEYVELDDAGLPTGRSTDTSMGMLLSGGVTFYF